MALLPLLLNELLDDCRLPLTFGDLYDQHFGLGLKDVLTPSIKSAVSIPGLRAGYLRPWRNMAVNESGISSMKNNDKEFSVKLDVTHFKPEELSVKLDDKRFVVVEGKHEEKEDHHGYVSRHFVRKYKLPDDVLQESLSSSLSSDGVLSLNAARKLPEKRKAEWEIQIVHTNEPAVKEPSTKRLKTDEQVNGVDKTDS